MAIPCGELRWMTNSILLFVGVLAGSACWQSVARAGGTDGRRASYVEFAAQERWSLQTQGDYHCRYDRRNLYCMYHLWTTAAEGDHATLTTTATIPADWQPPYGLEFYCADDYIVQPSEFTDKSWVAVHAYPGHRFKQVLVNGQVVWDVDVGDAGRDMCYGIDLSNLVKPGEPFELSLRVVDKVGTATKLEGEWFYPGNFDPKEDPRAFATHVYWGDLLLTERFDSKNLHPFRQSPTISTLQERIGKGLVPRGPATTAKAPAVLSLEAPRGVAAGYPFSCGVPLPQGAVKDGYQLRLYDAQGRDLAPQVDELSHWQDDSVRWVLVTLPLPADARAGDQWTLSWEAEPRRPDPGVRAREEGGELTVENGLISVRVPSSGSSAIEGVRSANGEELAGPLTGYLVEETDAGPVRYEARWDTRKVIGEGPRQITVELGGTLVGPKENLGRCAFRFSLTAGSPLIRAWYRIFNDTARQLKVTELTLSEQVAAGSARGHAATIAEPDGWVAVDSPAGSVFAAVRWEAEMPTKALEADSSALAIRLFKGTQQIPYFLPRSGEARRHELLLGYYAARPGDEELAAVAACCQRPPRLWNARYACETGALGYGYVHDNEEFPRLTENRLKHYGDISRDRVGQNVYDMRHFGDRRYGASQWCNNYYDANRGFIAEYLMTGNPNAFDRAEEEVLHQIDVDTCHWSDNPTFIGGLWTYSGDDHSNGGYVWAALLRCAAGWDYYYRLTGDPDAREALRNVAEYVLRDKHNVGFVSVRDHGGTLTALTWAYDEFGDERYLRGALETMSDVRTRMALRRGAYVEIHGNYSYWVMVPWMACETTDALYHLWQLSGNEEAAATALSIAEAMMTENGTWGVPGEVGGYSGNPWFNLTSNYNIIVAPIMGYGYEMTGDPEFLLWARACFDRTLDGNSVDAITNNYWLAPSLLYMLNRYADVETKMPEPPAERVPPSISRPH